VTAKKVSQALGLVGEPAGDLVDEKGLKTTLEEMATGIEDFRDGVRRFRTPSVRTGAEQEK
jgi:hypothetical protein